MLIYLVKLDQVHVIFNFHSPAQTHLLRMNACSVCPVPWQMAPSLALVTASTVSQHNHSRAPLTRTQAFPDADHFVAPTSWPLARNSCWREPAPETLPRGPRTNTAWGLFQPHQSTTHSFSNNTPKGWHWQAPLKRILFCVVHPHTITSGIIMASLHIQSAWGSVTSTNVPTAIKAQL